MYLGRSKLMLPNKLDVVEYTLCPAWNYGIISRIVFYYCSCFPQFEAIETSPPRSGQIAVPPTEVVPTREEVQSRFVWVRGQRGHRETGTVTMGLTTSRKFTSVGPEALGQTGPLRREVTQKTTNLAWRGVLVTRIIIISMAAEEEEVNGRRRRGRSSLAAKCSNWSQLSMSSGTCQAASVPVLLLPCISQRLRYISNIFYYERVNNNYRNYAY